MAQLYADEDFFLPVVVELRQLGHDVLTAPEAGLANQRIADASQLLFATSKGRAILTRNAWDFHRLHLQGVAHAGIIACSTDHDYVAQAQRIDAALHALPTLTQQWIRVYRS